MNKCLNCGKPIRDDSEVCSVECSKEYFKYVFDKDLKDYPEFKTKIEGKKELFYLVKIIFKEPDAVVYKNVKATKYGKFLESYPDIAFQKGLKVHQIGIIKQYEEVVH